MFIWRKRETAEPRPGSRSQFAARPLPPEAGLIPQAPFALATGNPHDEGRRSRRISPKLVIFSFTASVYLAGNRRLTRAVTVPDEPVRHPGLWRSAIRESAGHQRMELIKSPHGVTCAYYNQVLAVPANMQVNGGQPPNPHQILSLRPTVRERARIWAGTLYASTRAL